MTTRRTNSLYYVEGAHAMLNVKVTAIANLEPAASYACEMAENHPFVDGNKRMALSLAAMCLEING